MGRRFVATAIALSLLLTVGFVVDPGPYWMFAFTFVALPLTGVAIVAYLRVVLQDLRERDVL